MGMRPHRQEKATYKPGTRLCSAPRRVTKSSWEAVAAGWPKGTRLRDWLFRCRKARLEAVAALGPALQAKWARRGSEAQRRQPLPGTQ
jgi:hypothetical protein